MKYNLLSNISDRVNFEQDAAREIREAARTGAVTNVDEAVELFEQEIEAGAFEVDDIDFAGEIWKNVAKECFEH